MMKRIRERNTDMITNEAENIEYCEPDWLDIVLKQEEILRFDHFSRIDAKDLGLTVCRIAEEKYHSDVCVKVMMDGITAFSWFMGNTGLKNEWWISCKYNTMLQTKTSSMRALLERAIGSKEFEDWTKQSMSYFLCGGGFPICLTNGTYVGGVIVSALTHEADHQLVADAMAEYLGKKIPRIPITRISL